MKNRCLQGSRAKVSDVDMIMEILKDIPEGGQMVKLGANCPIALLIVALRPDIHLLSIEDGDKYICMEEAAISGYNKMDDLDKSRYECRQGRKIPDGLTEARRYSGQKIDLLFLRFLEEMTIQQVQDRIQEWKRSMAKPSWLVIDAWKWANRISEVKTILGRAPDKQSEWEAAWRFDG